MRNRGCGLLHLPGIENVEFPNFHRLVDLLEFELRVLLLVKGCSFFTRWLLQIHLLQTIGKIRTDRVALRCRCHSLQTTTLHYLRQVVLRATLMQKQCVSRSRRACPLLSIVHRQFFPILIQPPEEEEGDGRPEDAPERDEAVGVVAAVVEVLHQIHEEAADETARNRGHGAQQSVGGAELTVAIKAKADPPKSFRLALRRMSLHLGKGHFIHKNWIF